MFGTCAIWLLWQTSITACALYVAWILNASSETLTSSIVNPTPTQLDQQDVISKSTTWDSVSSILHTHNNELTGMKTSYRDCVTRRASECNETIQADFAVFAQTYTTMLELDTNVILPSLQTRLKDCESWIRYNVSSNSSLFQHALSMQTLLDLRNQTFGFLDEYQRQTEILQRAYQTVMNTQLVQSQVLMLHVLQTNVTQYVKEFIDWMNVFKPYQAEWNHYVQTCFVPSTNLTQDLNEAVLHAKQVALAGFRTIENTFISTYQGYMEGIFRMQAFIAHAMGYLDVFATKSLDGFVKDVQNYILYEHTHPSGGTSFSSYASQVLGKDLPNEWTNVQNIVQAQIALFLSEFEHTNSSNPIWRNLLNSNLSTYIQATYFPDYQPPPINESFLDDVTLQTDTFRLSASNTFQNAYVQTSSELTSALQHLLDATQNQANETIRFVLLSLGSNQTSIRLFAESYMQEAIRFAQSTLRDSENEIKQEFPSFERMLNSFPFNLSGSMLLIWIIPVIDFVYRYFETIRLTHRFFVSSATTAPIADIRKQDLATSMLTSTDRFSQSCAHIYLVFFSGRNLICLLRLTIMIVLIIVVLACASLNSALTPMYVMSCEPSGFSSSSSSSSLKTPSPTSSLVLDSINIVTGNWNEYARNYVFTDGDVSYSSYIDTLNTARYQLCVRFVSDISYAQYRNELVFESLQLQFESLRRILGSSSSSEMCDSRNVKLYTPGVLTISTCLAYLSHCELTCVPPQEERIQANVEPMSCATQAYILYQVRFCVLFILVFVWLNMVRDGIVSGMRRMLVNQLAPKEIHYMGTCDAFGNVLAPSGDSCHPETYAQSIRVGTTYACTIHQMEGMIEMMGSMIVLLMGVYAINVTMEFLT
jgi:hypothetical protein